MKFYRVSCASENKIYLLDYVLRTKCEGLVIIFVNSIAAAKKLKSTLEQLEFGVTNLHSHMK